MRDLGSVNPGLTCDAITLKNACAIVGESFAKGLCFTTFEKPSYAAAEPFIGQYPG